MEHCWSYPIAKLAKLDDKGNLNSYQLIIACPGITKNEVHATYSMNKLHIVLDEHCPDADENDELVSNDIEFGKCEYHFEVNGLCIEKVSIKVENGLIIVSIPAKETPKANEIKIG